MNQQTKKCKVSKTSKFFFLLLVKIQEGNDKGDSYVIYFGLIQCNWENERHGLYSMTRSEHGQ